MAKYRRKWKRNADSTAENRYINVKRQYYYEIKSAKSKCWNNFLENAKDKDIFKAFQYTKQNRVEKLPILQYQMGNSHLKAVTFNEKCDAFMKVLFTKPPSFEGPSWANYQDSKKWTWPKINKDEIKAVIFTSSTKKAVGPDIISFLII